MKTSLWAITILLVAPVGSLAASPQQDQAAPAATQQQESLAEAARRIRDQKKDHPKPAKVWDNSNLPSGSTISVVGKEPDASANASDSAAPAKPGDKAAVQGQYDEARKQLDGLKADLDIAQRKYILDDQMYRSQPNFTSDKQGAQAIEEEKADVEAKHDQVNEAQKKLDALQAQLDSGAQSATGGNEPENSK